MIETLKKIVGTNFVSSTKADISAYSYDSSGIVSVPDMVVWPGSADEIRKIVLACNRTNTSLVPRGLGTSSIGATIASGAIVMDMTRLNKLYSANFKNKLIDLEPGVILSSLNNYLRGEGFEFPIKPYFSAFHTIGGMAALNVLGPRSFKLGRMEKWVVSVEYLDGTGKYYVIKDGLRRVVGKEGCTGIILRMKLKITETITETTATVMEFAALPDLFAKLSSLKSEYDVLAIDYLSKSASAYMGLEYSDHLIVEYISSKGSIKQEAAPALKKREKVYDVLRPKGFYFLEDACGSPEKLYDLINWAESKELPVFGPIGQGVVFVMFQKEDVLSEFYSWLKSEGMTSGSVFGYGIQKKTFVPAETRSEIMRLKEEYDYNNILNRAKIVEFR